MRSRHIQHLLVRVCDLANLDTLPPGNVVQRIHGPVDHALQQRMVRCRGNRPLAKLHGLLGKAGTVVNRQVGFQSEDQVRIASPRGGEPVLRGCQGLGVKVRVEAAAGEEDEVAQKVGLDGGVAQGVKGLGDLGAQGEVRVDKVVGVLLLHQGVAVPGGGGDPVRGEDVFAVEGLGLGGGKKDLPDVSGDGEFGGGRSGPVGRDGRREEVLEDEELDGDEGEDDDKGDPPEPGADGGVDKAHYVSRLDVRRRRRRRRPKKMMMCKENESIVQKKKDKETKSQGPPRSSMFRHLKE